MGAGRAVRRARTGRAGGKTKWPAARRAAEAVLAPEERFRLLVEQSPLSMQIVSKDGKTLHVNGAFTKLWGLTLEDLSGYNLLKDPQLRETGILPYILKGFSGQPTAIPPIRYDVEKTLPGRSRHPDPKRWVRGYIYPVKDRAGRVKEVVLMHEDITDSKRLEGELKASEERLRALNAELEQRVAQRTAALEAANRELAAFGASVSHDLRAPVRRINGFAQILLKRRVGLDPENRGLVERILRSTLLMDSLISDILEFSRAGTAGLRRSRFALRQLVEDVISSLEPDAAGRTVRWAVGDLPQVDADRPLLRQVLVNLLGNALKFTGGRAEASIEIGAMPDSEGCSIFYVRDNGVGFDMDLAGQLFEPFQRLHGAEFSGTGLGLANVRRIVERHGGRVWARSRPQGGACFFVALPRAQP